jgi:hypothetical protein
MVNWLHPCCARLAVPLTFLDSDHVQLAVQESLGITINLRFNGPCRQKSMLLQSQRQQLFPSILDTINVEMKFEFFTSVMD